MAWTDSLTFITDKGTKSPKFGGNGGAYNLYTIPDGYRLVGLYGRAKKFVDKIGFIIGKNIYYDNGDVELVTEEVIIQ